MKTDELKQKDSNKQNLLSEIDEFRKWQIDTHTSMTHSDNYTRTITFINKTSSKLVLSKEEVNCAISILKKASIAGILQGRSTEALSAAVVYAVCRSKQIPRSLSEIARAAGVTVSALSQCYRSIISELKLEISIPNVAKYIERICWKLNLNDDFKMKSLELLNHAIKQNITAGKDPWGIAAAILYVTGMMTDNQVSQKDLARAADVSEVTVRNRYKELKLKLTY